MTTRIILKSITLFFSITIFLNLSAQVDKIEQALEDDNPKRALKLIENGMEDGSLKKIPEAYFLQAQTYYTLMKDPFYFEKNPEIMKFGIKAIEKGKYRNGGATPGEFDNLVDSFVILNNIDAYNQYKINKFTKAIKLYSTSYALNGDMTALHWRGKNQILFGDTALGEKDLAMVTEWATDEAAEGGEVDKEIAESFLYFGEKYWNKQQYDSANYYLEAGRKIFEDNARLDYYTKEVAKAQIKSMAPSPYMMEIIHRTLNFFPKEEFFMRKENALYVYQIRNYIKLSDKKTALETLDKFVRSKVAKSNSIDATFYKEKDRFIAEKEENVLWKLAGYYNEYDHTDASNYVVNEYIKKTAASSNEADIEKRYTVIISYAAKNKGLSMANQLLKYAENKYGESQELSDLRKSLIAQYSDKKLNSNDLGALYTLNLDNGASMDEDFENLVSKYIDALIKDKKYNKAKLVIADNAAKYPENELWNKKRIYLAKDDFYHNYYMTRVQEETVAGMKVNGFEWSGSSSSCEAGSVSDEIQDKIENRINYFRRQAGIPEIYLDPELNDWCQKAALMMHSNKKLDHEPKSNWRCFSAEGAAAAKNGLMTKGAHTSRAVTSFFADNQNPTLGNRRWLLFPNGKAYGHGSTDEYSVLWVLDDSGNIDSTVYETKFVAWPPEGYLPKMMVFKYWSFSLFQDLTGATVTMSSDGQNIPLTVQPVEDGYGMNTIVWQPSVPFSKATKDANVVVTVSLKNGRRYTYTVNVMNFNAIGY